MGSQDTQLDLHCINTIRFLAVDAVEKAKSGHPGAPMGMAPFAYTLWDNFLKFNPLNPNWFDRDRFVLSAGHASMLLYALLYLTGYDVSLEEIKNFRQWESKTPGHPEYGLAPGVEVTTGPLGQGFANGVGMAIAERWLASRYNRPGHEIINHHTYALVSDGDLQEGVSSEAASLAGTLGLGKLIYFYDDNEISIEGDTDLAFRENVGERFEAYGWQVIGPIDGNDLIAIESALLQAKAESHRPSLIICQTIIGYGSPKQGTAQVHGEPLGEEAARIAKENLGWPLDPAFHVPEEVLAHMRKAVERGQAAEQEWLKRMEAYAAAHPDLAAQLQTQIDGNLPADWDKGLADLFPQDTKPIATRSASGKVLNLLAQRIPALLGGSADLAPSTKTELSGEDDFSAENPSGRNLHFGVREHAMGSIAGGMARHGGVIPYTGTFLIFSDYMRPPMRLASIMRVRVIYVFTHDSIGLGEDGPTHQPIEQIMGLRTVPNLTVIRPADAAETIEAWRAALLNKEGPTALLFTRQNLPVLDRNIYASAEGLQRGGYVLWQSATGMPDIILIATGSEVHLALEAAEALAAEKVKIRVVSLPSWELFDRQPLKYCESVLPSAVERRVAIEAGVELGWERYVGARGAVVGMKGFGASAPYKTLFNHFGFTPEHVVQAVRSLLAGTSEER
ncbi:MAG: transketolase [Armatimonadetes bacterium]|nr:transketolase [Armatimonadota bacterium]NIM24449.1 transketolase [Armatimonadota bacterium]NIM68320.1 transketolase [Armatimonadota bacterium]NIM76724.1 transketolase [Armatimonadota bacterium]NIN06523.1 transketolase [Armatimonadota bacterium]